MTPPKLLPGDPPFVDGGGNVWLAPVDGKGACVPALAAQAWARGESAEAWLQNEGATTRRVLAALLGVLPKTREEWDLRRRADMTAAESANRLTDIAARRAQVMAEAPALAEANRAALVSLAGGYVSARVTDRRWVRVRPWRNEGLHDPTSDGIHVVDFQILTSNNGLAANDLEIEGTVKWDGCADWTVSGPRVHFCGADEAEELAACLSAAYALADDLMGGGSEFERPDFEPFVGSDHGWAFEPPGWP